MSRLAPRRWCSCSLAHDERGIKLLNIGSTHVGGPTLLHSSNTSGSGAKEQCAAAERGGIVESSMFGVGN
jgi:hypothetical protein